MAEETHVAVSHEAEPAAEAVQSTAAAAVATAGAAVALAQETAAHAELQAAEEIADIENEADEWRIQTKAHLLELGTGLASLNDRLSAIDSLEQTRHARDEHLNERLAAIEAHPMFQKSTPPQSETEPASVTETEPSLVGASAEANLGPAEAGGGLSLQNPLPEPQTSPSPARKRRWI